MAPRVRRLLLGDAAVVLLGAAVHSSTEARKVRRHLRHGQDGPLFPMMRTDLIDASRAMLSAVLLRAPPLSGERLRAAERGVARALADGDGSGAGATDLRLLLALLAARDGRFDEAIRRYGEAAQGDPSDHRPKALGHVLCLMTGRPVGDLRWEDADDIPRALAGDAAKVAQLFALVDELVVAAALGGAPFAIRPEEEGGFLPQSNLGVVRSAADRAGVGLAVALRDDEMPVAKRLQLAALRAFLHVSVESLFKTTTVFVAKFAKPKEGEDQESDKEAAA